MSLPSRSPRSATRPAVSPKRITSASTRDRGEKPCVPRCNDSSRLVLPAPFGPTTRISPALSSTSSLAYERMLRRETVWTISRLRRRLSTPTVEVVRALPAQPFAFGTVSSHRRQPQPLLPRQSDRHDQVRRVVFAALDHRGSQRGDQLQPDLIRR